MPAQSQDQTQTKQSSSIYQYWQDNKGQYWISQGEDTTKLAGPFSKGTIPHQLQTTQFSPVGFSKSELKSIPYSEVAPDMKPTGQTSMKEGQNV